MSLLLIVIIILLGLLTLFVEFFLIPGGGLIGLIGALIIAGGVYLTYQYYGVQTGHIVLTLSILSSIGITIFGFRRIANLGWADKETIDSKVNLADFEGLKKGDHGIAFGDIKPSGIAIFGNQRVEVFSIGEFIDRGSEIEIVKIEGNKIFVRPVKKGK